MKSASKITYEYRDGYYVSSRKGKKRKVVSLPRGYVKGSDGVYRHEKMTRKNPTKAQKRAKAKTATAKRKVATALASFLKKANPGRKFAGARVQKLGGGVIKITPIKLSRGRR